MKNEKISITDSPKKPSITVNVAKSVLNGKKYYPGDSVNEHKNLEEANVMIAGDEIRQQNNNL